MKKDWEIKTLQDVCSMKITDGTHQTPRYCNENEGGFPFISAKNVTKGIIDWDDIKYIVPELHEELYKRIAPQRDDILLAKNGTTGVAAIVDVDKIFDIYVTLAVLRPNKKLIDPKYLLYIVNSNYCKVQFDAHLKGIGVPNLHLVEIQQVHIPVPLLEEQKRIVKILDEKFAQLESLKTNAQINLQNTKELFQSQLTKAFSNNTWEKKTIGDICILKSGNSSSNNSKPGNLPYVKVGDMTINGNEKTITTSTLFVDYEENKKNIFPKGTVIFPKRGGAILTNKKRLTAVEICCDLNIMGVIPTDKILSEFLYYYFIGIDFAELCNGAAIPQINNIDINPLTIPLPPLPEQKRIVQELDTLSEKVRLLQEIYTKQIANCDELKQSLLQKAFEGEL